MELIRNPVRPLRKPEMVMKYAPQILKGSPADFDLKEQLCVAALDCGDFALAKKHIADLTKSFSSDSTRVQILVAKLMEAEGSLDKAKTLYEAMLKKNKANTMAMKRIAVVHRSKGELEEAVKVLQDVIKLSQADASAWKEMLSLQVRLGNVDAAAFCAEEVILSDPHNYLHHLMYAELRHSIGGEKNLLCGRRHFAQALELNPSNNNRALWGLCVAAKNLSDVRGKAGGRSDADTNLRLSKMASKKLVESYDAVADPVIAAAAKRCSRRWR